MHAIGLKKNAKIYLDSWAWERMVFVWGNCLISPLVSKARAGRMICMAASGTGVQALWTDSQKLC